MTRTLLHNAHLVTDRRIIRDGWLLLNDGLIGDQGTGDSWRSRLASDQAGPGRSDLAQTRVNEQTQVVDLRGAWLTPGFVDIHCHGAGGYAFDDGPEAALQALEVHRHHGTTSSLLSFVTDAVPAMAERLAWAAELTRENPAVLGSHAEGPFLDRGHRGAHAEELLVTPTPEAVGRLIDAAAGTLRQLTLAPELPRATEAIAQLREAGATIAIGHTDATYDDALRAFRAGAGILTHAFNAMNPLHHRRPGPVVAALECPDVALEVICDGVHVHPGVIAMLFASAPERTALITDAMSAACMHDGSYTLGALPVTVTDGVARLTEGNTIAGSTLTMDQAVKRAVEDVGLSVEQAVYAATQAPLQAIGAGDDRGRLAPGLRADLVVLDSELTVAGVYVAGETIR
ncbi:MAG: N-acetylglucosamine-6-phosphate deacetylase [Kocuria rhizophila]|nr:MAG: N-acetylglucosamine-6-phosphate deacetylase [Kocuria rhizophila]